MANLLLLFLYAVLVMLAIAFSISKLSHLFLRRFPESKPVGFMSGFVLALFSLIPAIYVAQKTGTFIALTVLFFAILGLLFLQLYTPSKRKEFYFLLICLIATLCIPKSAALSKIFPLGYLIMGITLYLMVHLFVLFDRIPNFSVITVITQSFLGFLLIRQGTLPQELLYPAFFSIAAIITAMRTNLAFEGKAILGPYAASVVGFEIGFIWLSVMGQGYFLVPAVLYSFNIFQLLIATCATLWVTHRVYPLTEPFLIEKAIETQTKAKKLYRFVFFISLLVAASAFLVIGDSIDYRSLVLILSLIMISVYFILNRWAVAQPTWRELGSDIKQGFLEVKQEINSLPLKKKTQKRKK